MATVEVTFTPLPVHVRTARLVATAVARRSGVAESLLDEVRLAVGEACSRAVEAHLRHCPGQPIRVALTDDGERFEVVVTDAAPGAEHDLPAGVGPPAGEPVPERVGAVLGGVPVATAGPDGTDPVAIPGGGPGTVAGIVPLQLPPGVGLAVIAGLADDFSVAPAAPASSGTIVTMSWKRRLAAL
jgi:serine/threonine-protein kinase RsbW